LAGHVDQIWGLRKSIEDFGVNPRWKADTWKSKMELEYHCERKIRWGCEVERNAWMLCLVAMFCGSGFEHLGPDYEKAYLLALHG